MLHLFPAWNWTSSQCSSSASLESIPSFEEKEMPYFPLVRNPKRHHHWQVSLETIYSLSLWQRLNRQRCYHASVNSGENILMLKHPNLTSRSKCKGTNLLLHWHWHKTVMLDFWKWGSTLEKQHGQRWFYPHCLCMSSHFGKLKQGEEYLNEVCGIIYKKLKLAKWGP